jgi:hypothetical protein
VLAGLLDAALKEITLQNNQVDILTCYLDKAAQLRRAPLCLW